SPSVAEDPSRNSDERAIDGKDTGKKSRRRNVDGMKENEIRRKPCSKGGEPSAKRNCIEEDKNPGARILRGGLERFFTIPSGKDFLPGGSRGLPRLFVIYSSVFQLEVVCVHAKDCKNDSGE